VFQALSAVEAACLLDALTTSSLYSTNSITTSSIFMSVVVNSNRKTVGCGAQPCRSTVPLMQRCTRRILAVTEQHRTGDGGNEPVTLRILDRDYVIRCPGEERALLEGAARRLNQALLDARNDGNIIDSERLTVMVALNLACELLELEQVNDIVQTRIGDQVKRMGRRLSASQACSPRLKGTP